MFLIAQVAGMLRDAYLSIHLPPPLIQYWVTVSLELVPRSRGRPVRDASAFICLALLTCFSLGGVSVTTPPSFINLGRLAGSPGVDPLIDLLCRRRCRRAKTAALVVTVSLTARTIGPGSRSGPDKTEPGQNGLPVCEGSGCSLHRLCISGIRTDLLSGGQHSRPRLAVRTGPATDFHGRAHSAGAGTSSVLIRRCNDERQASLIKTRDKVIVICFISSNLTGNSSSQSAEICGK